MGMATLRRYKRENVTTLSDCEPKKEVTEKKEVKKKATKKKV